MHVPRLQTTASDPGAPGEMPTRQRSGSWQAAWVRRAMPLIMALHFGSSRRPAPDVQALRLRAHRYSAAGAARNVRRLIRNMRRQRRLRTEGRMDSFRVTAARDPVQRPWAPICMAVLYYLGSPETIVR